VCTDGRTDGQADMTKLIVAFHNCPNALNKIDRTEFMCCVCVGCISGDWLTQRDDVVKFFSV